MIQDKEEISQQLREIAEKRASGVTIDDMELIKQLSAELKKPFEPKTTKCRQCYIDQAVVLWKALQDDDQEDGREYKLRPGIDMYFGSIRVNSATIDTDAKAKELLDMGFPIRFFVKLPQ